MGKTFLEVGKKKLFIIRENTTQFTSFITKTNGSILDLAANVSQLLLGQVELIHRRDKFFGAPVRTLCANRFLASQSSKIETRLLHLEPTRLDFFLEMECKLLPKRQPLGLLLKAAKLSQHLSVPITLLGQRTMKPLIFFRFGTQLAVAASICQFVTKLFERLVKLNRDILDLFLDVDCEFFTKRHKF